MRSILFLTVALWDGLHASGDDSDEVCAAEGCADVGSRLWAWMGENGCKMSGVEIRQLPSGERGIFATEDLEKDHPVLSLPVEMLVTLFRASSTPLGEAVLKLHSTKPFGDIDGILLTSFLVHEGGLADSGWAAYLSSLPQSFSTLGFNFTEEAVRECASGLAVEEYIQSRRSLLHMEYELIKAMPEAGEVSWERYLRARFAVFSRTFTLSRMKLNFDVQMNMGKVWASSNKYGVGGDAAKDEAISMIPLADMINHAQGADVNVKWKYEGMESGFTIRTKKPMAAGQELFLSYGNKGNDMLLAHYGFVVPENRNDKLAVELSLGGAGEEGVKFKLHLNGEKPADIEGIDALLEACRARSKTKDSEAKPRQSEALALRILIEALDEAAAPIRPPESCPAVCAAYRNNLIALLGTWRVFAERALGMLDPESVAIWKTEAMEPYIIHSRLYFGVWLRNKGRRVIPLDEMDKEILISAQEFGSVSYVDTLPEFDLD